MREVKFRAWQDGEIVAYERFVGDPITGMSHWIHVESTIDWGVYYPGVYPGEGIREQYTGIKDSEGVEVYEGDVVKSPTTCNPELHGAWATYEIVSRPSGFAVVYIASETGNVLPRGSLSAFICAALDDTSELLLWIDKPPIASTITKIGTIHDAEYAELAK